VPKIDREQADLVKPAPEKEQGREMKKIPIGALKEFANKYGCDHVIVFATTGKIEHVATWGRSIKDCDQAAQFGDMMKDVLGWPKSLHAVPNRVKRLQERVKELEGVLDEIEAEKRG
jgi:hypothetical protein